MDMIEGAALLGRSVHADPRGRLTTFEAFADLPFVPQRAFVMEVDAAGIIRGGHANSCEEVIVALRGAATVTLDNGAQTTRVRLEADRAALWISAGVVVGLEMFEAGTLLLVFASERYAETRHFAEPQPALLARGRPS